jgi:hypothetical protein
MSLHKELERLDKEIQDYLMNKTALTKSQLEYIYGQRQIIQKEIECTCKHDNAYIFATDEVDSGYGTDIHCYKWALGCEDCKQNFGYLCERGILDSPHRTDSMPIIDLVKKYPSRFRNVDLAKFGIKKIVKKTETVSYEPMVR